MSEHGLTRRGWRRRGGWRQGLAGWVLLYPKAVGPAAEGGLERSEAKRATNCLACLPPRAYERMMTMSDGLGYSATDYVL